ncbi:MAG: desulfoferrodoxin [Clostridia bacterium]|nr:desulfoferrodoxin [Clostridia bacterium]
MKELVIKKCLKCGALVEVLKDCTCDNCGIQCCGEQMKQLVPNSVDAAIEKHVPTYEVKGQKLFVTVNHVMEPDHYIEWIALATETEVYKKFFKPGEKAVAEFPYVPGSTVYELCNKHGLWKADVK